MSEHTYENKPEAKVLRFKPEALDYEVEGEKYDTRVTDDQIDLLKQEAVRLEELEADTALRIFREGLIPAAQSIVQIATYSNSEGLRFKAAQYVVERNLGRIKDTEVTSENDPLDKLLAQCVNYVDSDPEWKLAEGE